MKSTLFQSPKIQVCGSTIDGYGVFAIAPLLKGEIVEECHFIPFSIHIHDDIYDLNKFSWPKDKPKIFAIPLGFGCIYNSSSSKELRNADWETDTIHNLFIFRAVRNIECGEEILTYYGRPYWSKKS